MKIGFNPRNLTVRYDEDSDTIQVYRNGEWIDWKSGEFTETIIYSYGTQAEPLELTNTYTVNSNNITLSKLVASVNNVGILFTKNTIDLSKYNSLTIEGEFDILEDNSSNIRIGFVNPKTDSDASSDFIGNYIEYISDSTTKSKFVLDIKDMIGDSYLRISAYRALCLINKIYLS